MGEYKEEFQTLSNLKRCIYAWSMLVVVHISISLPLCFHPPISVNSTSQTFPFLHYIFPCALFSMTILKTSLSSMHYGFLSFLIFGNFRGTLASKHYIFLVFLFCNHHTYFCVCILTCVLLILLCILFEIGTYSQQFVHY